MKIPLNGVLGVNKKLFIDAAIYQRLIDEKIINQNNRFSLTSAGYVQLWNNKTKKVSLLHREIMKAKNGFVVDHLDGNPLNNQKSNLSICTIKENAQRRTTINKNNKSGFIGVHQDKSRLNQERNWLAKIMFERTSINIGCFNNKKEAAYVYDQVAIQLFPNKRILNFSYE